MIKIICLGKIKETYLEELIEDYKKRISKYHKIDLIELKDENDLNKESIDILKHLDDRDYVIACDIKGESMKSEDNDMRQGALTLDAQTGRMDIRFDLENYYGGLHCGECLDILINGDWVPTRIEMGDGWYLTGIKTDNLEGLIVRI